LSAHLAMHLQAHTHTQPHTRFYWAQVNLVWCSGNTLVLINAVALHRARLVLGWVTDCLWVGKLSHYVTSHPGQLSLAIPPWVGAISTGDGYGHR